MPVPHVAIGFLVLSALFLSVTYAYYLVIAPVTLLLSSLSDRPLNRLSEGDRPGRTRRGAHKLVLGSLAIANVTSSTAFFLPVLTGGQGTLFVSSELAGGFWMA